MLIKKASIWTLTFNNDISLLSIDENIIRDPKMRNNFGALHFLFSNIGLLSIGHCKVIALDLLCFISLSIAHIAIVITVSYSKIK